jgi:hypothetical protein
MGMESLWESMAAGVYCMCRKTEKSADTDKEEDRREVRRTGNSSRRDGYSE